MTTITCDLCDSKINGSPIRVELNDGEHPHSKSRMTKTVDCCVRCAVQIPELESKAEYDEMRRKLKVS